ncbi:hypothetical protein C0993_009085 [Termitomyces sp. T159_Od127]|nr:hypothetical protein C0993_009085 [Termitomyces sp. T159_Od127]
MIRTGATDNVLGYLSNSDVLRLRNVSAGSWEGYSVPENLQHYAAYLESRIRAYRDLKHDAIRVQADNNRDMRNSASIEEDVTTRGSKKGKGPFSKNTPSTSVSTSAGPARSKTIMGRKLRVMTVEKGLLRETKAVHRMIDALVECRFYLDNLEDELTIAALQMLVKDLLILFQAGNEGVINVLDNYFYMSHIDATEALDIYRNFCKQTERVVEFLGVAKKLQNLLNVPIPNLKHAPVSLAGSLQEYLEDPAFEQNRIEYKAKKAADKGLKVTENPKQSNTTNDPQTVSASKDVSESALPTPDTSSSASTSKPVSSGTLDFFAAIEEEQPTISNPQTTSPGTAYFQTQNISNPFARMQITGRSFAQAHPTGFINFQPTATQTNPFSMQQPQADHPAFASFYPSSTQPQATGLAQPQPTSFSSIHLPQSVNFAPPQPPQPPQPTGMLWPQATGANPFRQSMMFPQSTGMQLFGGAGVSGQATQNPFPDQNQNQATGIQRFDPSQPFTATGAAFSTTSNVASPFVQASSSAQPANVPARPSSTPLASFGSTTNSANSPPVVQLVKTHQTGTKNPFGPIAPAAPPPLPKQPTLLELKMGFGSSIGPQQPQQQQTQLQPQQQQQNSLQSGFHAFNAGALGPGATDLSSVASSFAFGNKPNATGNQSNALSASSAQPIGALNAQPTAASTISSGFSDSIWSSALSSQPTGTTNTSASSVAPIKSQITGFAGLKPFKPTSSFGASLLESLPPIPDSSSATPEPTTTNAGTASSATGTLSTGGYSSSTPTTKPFVTTQMTGAVGTFGSGSTLGQGLRRQMTGGGAANPFRASMIGFPNAAGSTIPPVPSLPTTALNSHSFGSNLFGGTGTFGSNSTLRQNSQQQSVETAIEHAKRAFALKKFEQAIEHYATALELMTKEVGEDSPETADLYFSYGKALLENAISQNSVLGKEQGEEGHEEEAAPAGMNGKGPILSFSGDADEVDGDDDPAVDLFAQAEKTIAEAEKTEEEEDEDGEDAQPEDDFNAAWEVLDLARAIYDKVKDQGDDEEVKLKLADTYIALGDVSLETEKFDQAITDYQAGLDLKIQLLPVTSRQIAEAHYKLSMVLDLTPGRLSDAIAQAEKALESVESRLAELRDGLSGQLPPLPEEEKPSVKGKGKSTGSRLVRDELVQNMSKSQIEAEFKEFSELREDLALKVEELKTTPNSDEKSMSAPAMAARALDKELNAGSSAASVTVPDVVNDLTSIVKKKKPTEKRKADADAESSTTEKKARIDTPEA